MARIGAAKLLRKSDRPRRSRGFEVLGGRGFIIRNTLRATRTRATAWQSWSQGGEVPQAISGQAEEANEPAGRRLSVWYFLAAVLAVLWLPRAVVESRQVEPAGLTAEFQRLLKEGQIKEITISEA